MSMREGSESSVAAVPARAVHYMRPGFTSITPYIIVNGASEFIEFLKKAFSAAERLRVPMPDGKLMHAEVAIGNGVIEDRKSTRLNSSHVAISYAVFCLKKKRSLL